MLIAVMRPYGGLMSGRPNTFVGGSGVPRAGAAPAPRSGAGPAAPAGAGAGPPSSAAAPRPPRPPRPPTQPPPRMKFMVDRAGSLMRLRRDGFVVENTYTMPVSGSN